MRAAARKAHRKHIRAQQKQMRQRMSARTPCPFCGTRKLNSWYPNGRDGSNMYTCGWTSDDVGKCKFWVPPLKMNAYQLSHFVKKLLKRTEIFNESNAATG